MAERTTADLLTEKRAGLEHALAHVQADLEQARRRVRELESQALMLQGGILTLGEMMEEAGGDDEPAEERAAC